MPELRQPPAAGDWRQAAELFYDREAGEKSLPGRHSLFADSYRSILPRLGIAEGSLILDAGCGCGELSAALKGVPVRVVGADVSRISLVQARRFHPQADFLGADIARMPFRDGTFDAITAITSVEFCRDKAAVFREFYRLLKERGRLYLDVRNASFLPFRLLKPLLPVLQSAGILEPYPAEGFRDLSWREWERECAQQGFRLLSVHPSAWPWNFGSLATRSKNLLIQAVKCSSGIRNHYMVGFLLEKHSAA